MVKYIYLFEKIKSRSQFGGHWKPAFKLRNVFFFEDIRKEARKRYQNLSEEEKGKKQKSSWQRYQNVTEEETEKKCNKNLINYLFFLNKKNKNEKRLMKNVWIILNFVG